MCGMSSTRKKGVEEGARRGGEKKRGEGRKKHGVASCVEGGKEACRSGGGGRVPDCLGPAQEREEEEEAGRG